MKIQYCLVILNNANSSRNSSITSFSRPKMQVAENNFFMIKTLSEHSTCQQTKMSVTAFECEASTEQIEI